MQEQPWKPLYKNTQTREKSSVSQDITDARIVELMIYERQSRIEDVLQRADREADGFLWNKRARGYLPRNATACERWRDEVPGISR